MLKSRVGRHGLFETVGTSKGCFISLLGSVLNRTDFPSDTSVLSSSSKGSQWGLTLRENDAGVFEVGGMLPTSVSASSRESLPVYTS